MFSLIITIISIALVAALALATLYYGGAAFNKGSAGATAAKLINEGQQINGAVQILKADIAANSVHGGGTAPTTVEGLAPNYLAQLPTGWNVNATLGSGVILTTDAVSPDAVEGSVCAEVNKRAGLTGVVDVAAADAVVANPEESIEGSDAKVSGVYGCITASGADQHKVFYKF